MIEDRFWSKVNKNGPVPAHRPDLGACWLWGAGKNQDGYGRFWDCTRKVQAHRFAYELLIGPIPNGLELDHLCRVRNCVNGKHMEPVTHQENARRGEVGLAGGRRMRAKTHCPRGHAYDSDNTYRNLRGQRSCRTCCRVSARLKYQQRVAATG